MDQRVFNEIRKIIYDRSGINLSDGKKSLVAARLVKRLRELQLEDERAYLDQLTSDATGAELVQLLDVISTNVTEFYRHPEHFEFLTQQLKAWMAEGQTKFRIWSAACSTGQEPYTIAMAAKEATEGRMTDTAILATDISTRVLNRAMEGVYGEDEMRGVTPDLRSKYFSKELVSNESAWRVRPALRKMVLFRRMNLSTPPFPMQGPLDIVFCRNVMIYFDDRVRKALLGEIHRLLRPDGFLIVSSSESLTGLVGDFSRIRPAIYCKQTA